MESPTTSALADRSESHRACANCSRAKSKCTLDDPSHSTCQRCTRLNKLCEPNPVRIKTQPRKRKPLESTRIAKYRVEKLEEKLDDLVSLLKSGQENANAVLISPPESTTAPLSNASIDHSLRPVQSLPPEPSKDLEADNWDDRLHNGGTVFNRFGIPNHSAAPLKVLMNRVDELPPYQFGDINLGEEDPDTLLDIYRNEMHSNFPFVVIPASQSAAYLRQHRPTLYTALMAVTTRNSAQQTQVGKQLIQQIAERVHIRGERNLDLLLGILTYAGWYGLQLSQRAMLTATATTVVGDMRLNSSGDQCVPNQFFCGGRTSNGQEIPRDKARSMEERRCFLGYWYLNSMIAGFFRRLDRPVWAAYNEECCQVLETSPSNSDDLTAARLIRIQLFGSKIFQSPWHMKQEMSGSVAPPALYLDSFQNELEELKRKQRFELEKNVVVLLSYQGVETMIYKTGLSKSPVLESFTIRDFDRVGSLYACHQSVKRFFDIFLAVEVEQYHCWSVPAFTTLAWNLGILQLLSTFDHPAWNTVWANDMLSFGGMLDLLSERNGRAKAALRLDPHTLDGDDMFSHVVKKLQWIKAFHEGKISSSSSGAVQSDDLEPSTLEMPDFMQGAGYAELMEDEWMQDLLGPWDY